MRNSADYPGILERMEQSRARIIGGGRAAWKAPSTNAGNRLPRMSDGFCDPMQYLRRQRSAHEMRVKQHNDSLHRFDSDPSLHS